MKCPECNVTMKESTELIFHKGDSMPIEIVKCPRCSMKFTHIDNFDVIKKQFKPNLIERAKSFFESDNFKTLDITKGKIL